MKAPKGGAEQRVLDALAELESMHVSQAAREIVGFLSGYSNIQSPGFRNAISSLNQAGCIEYPVPGEIRITPAGRSKAQKPPKRSAAEIQQRIVQMLAGATGRVLGYLLKIHPGEASRERLGAESGYTNIQSPGFRDALSKLRSLSFIEYPTPGMVRAAKVLFLGGAK